MENTVTDSFGMNLRMMRKEASSSAFEAVSVSYCTTDCTTRFFGMAGCHPLRKAGCSKELWSREWDLNPQPPLYESGALPLSYLGQCWASTSYKASLAGARV